jgi:alkylation response protein AidB-like acyl-CoA dehydrogenase
VPADGRERSAEEWRTAARAFADREILPRNEEIARTERIPTPIRDGLARGGFMGLTVPQDLGGSSASTLAVVQVLSEIARGSAAVATLLSVHLSVACAPIVSWGTPEQKARYLPAMATGERLGAFALTEPGAGSDAGAIQTRFRREPEGFRLDGSKMFITNGGLADLLLLFATEDPVLGRKAVSAFLVEHGTPGLSVSQKLAKLGLDGSETTELVLDGVRLPADARLGPEGQGIRIALKALTDGRVGIAACALGVAEASLEELIAAARRSAADVHRARAARAYAEVLAARALVERAARTKDAGEPFVEAASAAKLIATRAAVDASNAAVEVAGFEGGLARSRASGLLRDARVFPIVEGTSEVQELILGRSLVGTR